MQEETGTEFQGLCPCFFGCISAWSRVLFFDIDFLLWYYKTIPCRMALYVRTERSKEL